VFASPSMLVLEDAAFLLDDLPIAVIFEQFAFPE
jgi:hypothetical protein